MACVGVYGSVTGMENMAPCADECTNWFGNRPIACFACK